MSTPPVERADWLREPDGLEPIPDGTPTSVPGFVAGATACGIKPSGVLDLGILRSVPTAVSAMVDTTNALPSAPVLLNRQLDRARFQGVVVNAGNANAATGSPGLDDARAMALRAAFGCGLPEGSIAVSSTGTIGARLDGTRVLQGIDVVASRLSPDGGADFAKAIQTTDRFAKSAAFRLALSSAEVTIGAVAKGAGMIRPTMATMLAYLTTDAALSADDLLTATRTAAEHSFNRISVDGQMSPSDTLLILANGQGPVLTGADLDLFTAAISSVCRRMAILMVKDGEGADHAVRILVTEAADDAEAERVVRAVGDSPLVKTAIFGRDPNWGRLSQAVGAALVGATGAATDLRVSFDGIPVDDPAIAEVMSRAEYDIEISLCRGTGEAELWACDLGHAYVTLNAEYHT